MTYTIDTVEEAFEELPLGNGFLLEEDEEHQIWLDGPFIRIPELNIDIYPGLYCQYDEEEKEYQADFSIYVFMSLGTKDVVYDEGYTSFGAAVHNYSLRTSEYREVNVTALQYEVHADEDEQAE